jgi:hypothetical protein
MRYARDRGCEYFGRVHACAVLRSTLRRSARRDLRSVRVTIACRCPFPIIVSTSQSLTNVDNGRPLLDAHPVGKLSTPIVAAIALPVSLLASQVTIEAAPCMFICQDVLVDPLMADPKGQVRLEPCRDLLRAPVLMDQELDQSPVRENNVRFGSPTSLPRHVMGLLRTVAAHSAIAPQLATDSRLMSTNHVGNIGLVMSCFHKSVNLVSLFLGVAACRFSSVLL